MGEYMSHDVKFYMDSNLHCVYVLRGKELVKVYRVHTHKYT